MERVLLSKIVTGTNPYENITPGSTVIIGRAHTGPAEVPIEGTTLDDVEKWYGKGSSLTRGYIEFRKNSNAPVFLIKENGNPGVAYLTGIDPGFALLKIVSIDFMSDVANTQARVVERLGKRYFEIASVAGEVISMPIDGLKAGDIASTINKMAYAGRWRYFAVADDEADASELIPQYVNFEGSSDELLNSLSRMANILDELREIPLKQISMLSYDFSRHMSGYGMVYQILSTYMRERERSSNPCFINIGVSVGTELGSLDAQERALTLSDPAKLNLLRIKETQLSMVLLQNFFENEVPGMHISPYINLIVGGAIKSPGGNYSLTNFVAAYSGVISTSSVFESTSNAKIHTDSDMMYMVFSDEEVKQLSKMGYTVIIADKDHKQKVYRGVNLLYGTGGYVNELEEIDGVLQMIQAYRAKDLGNIANAMILQRISLDIKEALEVFIGQSNIKEAQILKATTQVLKRYETAIKQSRIIVNKARPTVFDYQFTEDISVEIYIVPYGMMEELKVGISIW